MRGLNRCRVAALGQRGRAGAGIGDRRRHLPRVRALSQQRQPGPVRESLDHGFSNIEFWGGYAAPPVETVQQLLRAAGIAQQVTLYFPFPWMAALTAYALCPAGLVLLAAARTLGGRVRRGCPKETCWFVLGGAFLLALVLPALLRLLPPWITPARWSDFSYWGGLLPAVGKAIETGFSLNPCAKDVLAKWNTLGLLIAATLANVAAGKLMLSRQQKNSTNL